MSAMKPTESGGPGFTYSRITMHYYTSLAAAILRLFCLPGLSAKAKANTFYLDLCTIVVRGA